MPLIFSIPFILIFNFLKKQKIFKILVRYTLTQKEKEKKVDEWWVRICVCRVHGHSCRSSNSRPVIGRVKCHNLFPYVQGIWPYPPPNLSWVVVGPSREYLLPSKKQLRNIFFHLNIDNEGRIRSKWNMIL